MNFFQLPHECIPYSKQLHQPNPLPLRNLKMMTPDGNEENLYYQTV
jgi:hypothetical protein